MIEENQLEVLLEAIILAAGRTISLEEILNLFPENERPNKKSCLKALQALQNTYETRGISLVELASGYQFQVKVEWAPIVSKLWEEKSQKHSRAFLETLALIAYRQPITRGEIEEIRGVTLSSSIFKTLLEEREWIRVVGHREVPGRPALYATTKKFLDYFGLKTLEGLPPLPEVMNLDAVVLPEEILTELNSVEPTESDSVDQTDSQNNEQANHPKEEHEAYTDA